jgi:hypothetical protein
MSQLAPPLPIRSEATQAHDSSEILNSTRHSKICTPHLHASRLVDVVLYCFQAQVDSVKLASLLSFTPSEATDRGYFRTSPAGVVR